MENTALIIVDLQNDYFSTYKEAKWPLHKTEEVCNNTLQILEKARKENIKVIYVRHEFQGEDAPFFQENSDGAQIHHTLQPKTDEIVVLKNNVNSFKGTQLKSILDDSDINNVIITGAMSHICIDAITRASSDYGYNCYVVHDACAAKDVEFNGIKVEASLVHAAFMSSLEFAYAKVLTTNEIIELI